MVERSGYCQEPGSSSLYRGDRQFNIESISGLRLHHWLPSASYCATASNSALTARKYWQNSSNRLFDPHDCLLFSVLFFWLKTLCIFSSCPAFGDRPLPLPGRCPSKHPLVEIFPVWTVGMDMAVTPLWQAIAIAKMNNLVVVAMPATDILARCFNI